MKFQNQNSFFSSPPTGENFQGDNNSGTDEVNENSANHTESNNLPLIHRPKKCCGCYPNRFVYNAVDRKCCGKGTYNAATKSCCNGNELLENGYSSGDQGDNWYVSSLKIVDGYRRC